MGRLEILGAVTIWAVFNGVLVKLIKSSGVSVGMWTGIVGTVFCLSWQSLWPIEYANLGWFPILMLICLGASAGLNNACNYTAIKISLPVALLFHYLAPMIAVIWALMFKELKEPVHFSAILALVIGLCGIIYMARPYLREGSSKLVVLGMLSAFFYSLEIVLSGYITKQLQVAIATSTFSKLLFQAITMPVVGYFFVKESVKADVSDGPLLIFGGFILYLSFLLYFAGSATVGPLERGIFSYIDRIGAIALGALCFKEEREKITREVWVGGALILGSSLLIL